MKSFERSLSAALASPRLALEILDRLDAEASLTAFVRQAWSQLEPAGRRYLHNWHIDALSTHLEAVSRGEITRLLINVPPGTMKSLLVSVCWPAWEWGPRAQPHLRIIAASYAERLSMRDNVRSRRLLTSSWFRRHWGARFRLARDQNAKLRFENDRTGFRLATSVGGLGTGERGDRFLIDDPHNVAQSESRALREKTLRWFSETVPTRLNDPEKSAIVVVMQRVHEADVSGHILARELGYERLILPMEFEKDRVCATCLGTVDPRREDGALLWPERFPEREVVRLKRTLGPYATAGQLQQRPAPRSGGLFRRDWFAVVPAAPALARRVRHWDLAATRPTAGRQPDWTVSLRLARDEAGIFYVEDVIRLRGEGVEVRRAIRAAAEADGAGTAISLPQDPGQAGKIQAQDLVRLLAGFDARARRETGSKLIRAEPVAAQAAAGNLKLVAGAWNGDFMDEAVLFPLGSFHDQVDALSGAFAHLAEQRPRWFG